MANFTFWQVVTYWHPAELSDEKCTCVNNRCIRSNISGDNLDCQRVELSANVTLTRSRLTSNYDITPMWQEFRSVGEKMLEWEPCPSRGWAPRPPVEQLRRTGKKVCDNQKSCGGVNTLQSLFVLQLTSHTQPFRIKWEVYFSKELCLLVVIVSLLCFCTYMCIVGHGYTKKFSIFFLLIIIEFGLLCGFR